MARIHQIIESLFGTAMTEDAILDAFCPDHLEFTTHAMAEANGEGVFVHGEFHSASSRARYAGRFERRLYRDGSGAVAAYHQWFEVEEDFQRRDLAKAHLTKLIRFYDRYGVEYIHLEAAIDGPVVWPQLGFEFREPGDLKLLYEKVDQVVSDLGYEVDVPKRASRISLMPRLAGVPPGLRALGATYSALGRRPIPMLMDLHDNNTRTFLASRGILTAERT